MSKNQLFYQTDNESTPSIPPNSIPLNSSPQILSSPFLKPKVPLVTRYAKINKIKKPTNKPSAHHKNKTNKETNRTAPKNGSIWDLTNVASNNFTQEFKIDKSGIRMKDYKWGPISSNLVEIALQPWTNNIYDSISSGLSEYSKKIDNFLPEIHQDQVGAMKQKLIRDIVKQIRKQLHKCVFPNDTNDIIRNDMDPEYIFAKRKHIQSLIDNMTKEVHLLKEELKKESNQLNEAKNFIRNLKRTNNQLLKQNLLDQTLHPLVNKVLQNEYGLIKIDQLSKLNNNNNNNNNNNEKKEEEEEGEGENEDIILKYSGPMRRNIATYNLIISTDLAVNDDNNNNDQYEIVADSLPSLIQLNEFIPSMSKIIDRILSTKQNKQLQELFPA